MRALFASLVVVGLAGCGSSQSTPGSGGSGGSETGGNGGRGGTGGGAAGSGGGAAAGSDGGGGLIADAATVAPDAAAGADDASSSADTASNSDTWETFAKGFFASFCVSCHDDDKKGVATRDYHQLANVMKEKAEIACGVASSPAAWTQRGCKGFPPARQFPVGNGPKPTDAERDRLLRWIDAGAI
jgi:cytochrome c553